MKITIEHYNTKLTAELPDDSDLRAVTDCIKGMLIACGWGVKLIEEYIKEEK